MSLVLLRTLKFVLVPCLLLSSSSSLSSSSASASAWRLQNIRHQAIVLIKRSRLVTATATAAYVSSCLFASIPSFAVENNPSQLVQVGMARFRNTDVKGSIQAFDDAIQLRPELRRLLWQRGLSLYYAGRFVDGAQQFRDDIALNPQDAEEIVWTALCESQFRTGGFTEAVQNMPELPLPERRPVMRAVLALFRGLDGAENKLMEVGNGASDNSKSSPDYFYSRLYLSLWHEAQGHRRESDAFIREAVGSEYGRTSGDYMAALAKVHAKLRLE